MNNLKRFTEAQYRDYEQALKEIKMEEKKVIGCGIFFRS